MLTVLKSDPRPLPYIDFHTHNRDSSYEGVLNIELSEINNSMYAHKKISLGIHPWMLGQVSDHELSRQWQQLADIFHSPSPPCNLALLGEVGLDRSPKHKQHLTRQHTLLEQELTLNSETLHLPVLLHSVRCSSDLLALRKQKKYAQEPWILHGFRDSVQNAEKFLNLNCFLSLAEAIPELVAAIPLNRLLLESDEKVDIDLPSLYQKVADSKGISLDELQANILQNYHELVR